MSQQQPDDEFIERYSEFYGLTAEDLPERLRGIELKSNALSDAISLLRDAERDGRSIREADMDRAINLSFELALGSLQTVSHLFAILNGPDEMFAPGSREYEVFARVLQIMPLLRPVDRN